MRDNRGKNQALDPGHVRAGIGDRRVHQRGVHQGERGIAVDPLVLRNGRSTGRLGGIGPSVAGGRGTNWTILAISAVITAAAIVLVVAKWVME